MSLVITPRAVRVAQPFAEAQDEHRFAGADGTTDAEAHDTLFSRRQTRKVAGAGPCAGAVVAVALRATEALPEDSGDEEALISDFVLH